MCTPSHWGSVSLNTDWSYPGAMTRIVDEHSLKRKTGSAFVRSCRSVCRAGLGAVERQFALKLVQGSADTDRRYLNTRCCVR